MGIALLRLGEIDGAVKHYERALSLKPNYPEAHSNLGALLLQQQRWTEAVEHLAYAVMCRPDDEVLRLYLGTALLWLDKLDEAAEQFQQALRLKPDYGEAKRYLGVTYSRLGEILKTQGNLEGAVEQYKRAVGFGLRDARVYGELGVVLSQLGRYGEAVENLSKAVELEPDSVSGLNNMAWVLATCPEDGVRDGGRAVELAERANRMVGGGDVVVLDTLAAAYAEAGRYTEAVGVCEKAYEKARGMGQEGRARQIMERLEMYRAGRPYRMEVVSGGGKR